MTTTISLALLLSFGLAIDAVVLQIAQQLSRRPTVQNWTIVISPLLCGLFQAIMPLIGYYSYVILPNSFSTSLRWLAGGIFIFFAIKELIAWWRHARQSTDTSSTLTLWTLIVGAIATSLDAAAVGVTLPVLKAPLLLTLTIIGVVTCVLCLLSAILARSIQQLGIQRQANIMAAIIFIALAFKIFLF